MIRNLGRVDAGAACPLHALYFPFSPTNPTTMFKLLLSMCPLKFLRILQKNIFSRTTLGFITNNHCDKFLKPRKSVRYHTIVYFFKKNQPGYFPFSICFRCLRPAFILLEALQTSSTQEMFPNAPCAHSKIYFYLLHLVCYGERNEQRNREVFPHIFVVEHTLWNLKIRRNFLK